MSEVYPFYDFMRHPEATKLDSQTLEAIEGAEGPVVEIGGPTKPGYRLLTNTVLLPSRPIITDLIDWDRGMLDAIVDGTSMPFPDNSVGMFLASHISYADLFSNSSTEESQQESLALAKMEYDRFLEYTEYVAQHNLRIKILLEMTRAIKPGGLAVFEALNSRDVEVAEKLGWGALHVGVNHCESDPYLDCVLQSL